METNENERRIDATFARLAARPHHVDAFESALAAAESHLDVELRAPGRDTNRPVELTRRTIERGVRGYVGWIASQLSAFDRTIVSAVHELGKRVHALEDTADVLECAVARLDLGVAMSDGLDDGPGRTREDATHHEWAGRVLDALGHLDGRVLHADAGRGGIVTALQANDLDAYGVEPSYAAYEVGVEEGLEIHYGGVIEHLRRVPAGALSGIVLSGCVERLGVPDLLTISSCVGAVLERGGRIVICSATPEHWVRANSPIAADLAPGRPLHSATWAELFARERFDEIIVRDGPQHSLERLSDATPGAAAINANFDGLRALFDGPEWYVVSATRGGRA